MSSNLPFRQDLFSETCIVREVFLVFFRSPNTGLYDNLDVKEDRLPFAEAVFDLRYFLRNPVPFFKIAPKLYPGNYAPNAAHYFVRLLQDKGHLLRMYTQNIDGLESGTVLAFLKVFVQSFWQIIYNFMGFDYSMLSFHLMLCYGVHTKDPGSLL